MNAFDKPHLVLGPASATRSTQCPVCRRAGEKVTIEPSDVWRIYAPGSGSGAICGECIRQVSSAQVLLELAQQLAELPAPAGSATPLGVHVNAPAGCDRSYCTDHSLTIDRRDPEIGVFGPGTVPRLLCPRCSEELAPALAKVLHQHFGTSPPPIAPPPPPPPTKLELAEARLQSAIGELAAAIDPAGRGGPKWRDRAALMLRSLNSAFAAERACIAARAS